MKVPEAQSTSRDTSNSLTPGETILGIKGLAVKRDARMVLTDINLAVDAGECVTLTGPSGSGKTTLLSCILGLLPATEGSIVVSGEVVDARKRRRSATLRRRKMGVVFQAGELLPELSPIENVLIAALLNGTSYNEAHRRARALLGSLGVPSARRSTAELSGGERQRVAVARALVNDPVLLLADEPTGSLDPQARSATLDLLLQASRDRGCALLMVSHDPEVASRANRSLRLVAGRLIDSPQSTVGFRKEAFD